MIIPPFTYKEALKIAQRHQKLVGQEYLCRESKLVYKIVTVGILPFFEYGKLYLTHLYLCLMRKVEGYSVDTIIDFIFQNKADVYDVVLSFIPTEHDHELMVMKSIDTIATQTGLEYSFNIHTI